MKKTAILFLFLHSFFSFAQCHLKVLAEDLSRNNKEFKEFVNENSGFKAWQILEQEGSALRTDISELSLVSRNLEAIGKAEGYTKWKALGNVVTEASKLTSKIVDGAKKYFINGLEVGSARISNGGYIGFDIRIPSELQKQGYASQIFEDAIIYYQSQNKGINGIEGRWLSSNSYEGGMSTNLKSFIDDFLYKGKTFEEAALNTPTGKIAKKKWIYTSNQKRLGCFKLRGK